jgi:translation initiation factor IF-2
LSVAAVVAAVVWLGPRRPAAPPPGATAPANVAPAPPAAPAAPVAPVAPVIPPPVSRPAVSAPPPGGPPDDGRTSPPSPGPARSNTFEHPARRSIKRAAPAKAASRPAKSAAARDDEPAEPQKPADHRPIDIERDNPYRP